MFSFFLLRHGQAVLATIGIAIGMFAWAVLSSSPDAAKSVDPARLQAWEKIEPRLRGAEQRSAESSERQVQRVRDFFVERRGRTNAFAEDLLGWGGKWAFVKGKLTGDDGRGHREHMRRCFEQHIFHDTEVKELLESVVTAFLSELEGQENTLMVQIQADLTDQNLPALRGGTTPNDVEWFQSEYRKMADQVAPVLNRDLAVTAGREAGVWVGSDIATAITVRVGSAVAVRLGISGGILGSGAASGAVTLGIGVVVGILVDYLVDWIMRRAGYDPAAEVAREVSATLGRMEGLMVDGQPEAQQAFQKLRHLQRYDRFSFVREECRKSADAIDGAGVLGLRHELNRLGEVRGRLREAALRRLLLEGGAP